jgi:hypothetical protein
MKRIRPTILATAALALASLHPLTTHASIGQTNGTHNLFVRSAAENAAHTQVTLPLHAGRTQGGQTVWYVVLDSSSRADAARRRVNYVPKLANAVGTAAVRVITTAADGAVIFPNDDTIDFSPLHVITPGPTGFPPAAAQAGAVGLAGYTPLIRLPDGTVLNAPQIANASGQADKVITLDPARGTVTYQEQHGFYDNRNVYYASFDSSSPVAAAIEDVTYAPNLNAAPSLGDESHASAREGLIAYTNGQTGSGNPQRQGLNSALLDGISPLNILHEVPEGQSDPGFPVYSPLWDVRLAQWAVTPSRQTDFGTVLGLVQQGQVVGFDGTPQGTTFGASGFIVNCPLISMDPADSATEQPPL